MRRKFQNTLIIVLGLAIIVMSAGYATFASPKVPTTPVSSTQKKWDVAFENVAKLNTTTISDADSTAPVLAVGEAKLDFAVSLNVNENYDFIVDVANRGTVEATLTDISWTIEESGNEIANTINELTGTSGELEYSISYVDGTEIAKNDILRVGAIKMIKISVKRVANEVPEGTVLGTKNYEFSLSLNYE